VAIVSLISTKVGYFIECWQLSELAPFFTDVSFIAAPLPESARQLDFEGNSKFEKCDRRFAYTVSTIVAIKFSVPCES